MYNFPAIILKSKGKDHLILRGEVMTTKPSLLNLNLTCRYGFMT